MAWIDAMLRDGVQTWVTIDHFAARADGHQLGPVPLRLRRRYMRPVDLNPRSGDGLIVFSRATASVMRSLDAAGHAWATLDGRYRLPLLDRRRDEPQDHDPIASRHQPNAEDELAVLRVAMPAATHAEYAAALGITRSRVTQLLRSTRTMRTVRPSPTSGHVTRWWSDHTPWEQTKAAYDWLETNGCGPVLGGETGADATAPWRAPASTVMHVRKITPPPPGFVPADSHETATMTVVVDYRPSVLAVASTVDTPVGSLRVAHPLHIVADLADAADSDERATEQTNALEHARVR